MTMKQTPAHAVVNRDLLALMPVTARRVVEVGCMHESRHSRLPDR